MATTLESANRVWQKANQSLNALDASPAARNALAEFKKWLGTQKAGAVTAGLQFIPFSAAQTVVNNGYTPGIGGVHTVYFVYVKGARTSGTTAAFFAVHDAADNTATTTTVVTGKFKVTGEEYVFGSQAGMAMATDLTLSCATAVGGATESAAADAGNGFVIIGS